MQCSSYRFFDRSMRYEGDTCAPRTGSKLCSSRQLPGWSFHMRNHDGTYPFALSEVEMRL